MGYMPLGSHTTQMGSQIHSRTQSYFMGNSEMHDTRTTCKVHGAEVRFEHTTLVGEGTVTPIEPLDMRKQ